MVIRLQQRSALRRAWLMIDLLVAMALLTVALLPIAYSIGAEKRFARSAYQRAIALALVDGEAEVLAAGTWREFPNGVHDYSVSAPAVTNLPPGRFILTVEGERFRLEWHPGVRGHGGSVVREVNIK